MLIGVRPELTTDKAEVLYCILIFKKSCDTVSLMPLGSSDYKQIEQTVIRHANTQHYFPHTDNVTYSYRTES